MIRAAGLLACMVFFGAPSADAQGGSPANRLADRRGQPFGLLSGDSVRVRLPGALQVSGIAATIDPVGLHLRTEGLDALWPVGFLELSSLEVYRRRSSRQGFRHGVGMGLAVGLFFGVASGLMLHATGVWQSDSGGPAERMIRSGLRLAGVGAAGGAMVGGFFGGAHPGVGWVSIPLPRSGARGR